MHGFRRNGLMVALATIINMEFYPRGLSENKQFSCMGFCICVFFPVFLAGCHELNFCQRFFQKLFLAELRISLPIFCYSLGFRELLKICNKKKYTKHRKDESTIWKFYLLILILGLKAATSTWLIEFHNSYMVL